MQKHQTDRTTGESTSASYVPIHRRHVAQHYHLRCSGCGYRVEDDGLQLQCSRAHCSALLSAEYEEKSFCISPSESGLYRYRSWLPIRRTLSGATGTYTYRSEALCRLTGLDNLWIAFHGYWPERNAYAGTGTFKDLEAYCVLGRLPDLERSVLLVASAGNTAAAFADACSRHSVQCLIVIPHFGLERFRVPENLSSSVKIVVLTGGADYADAVALSETITAEAGFVLEGGTKNVARRGGLGVALLSAYEAIGRVPHYYFQAIGSGAGAIAVHETARLLTKGRGPFPSLQLSQNLPFAPIYEAWQSRSRRIIDVDPAIAKLKVAAMSTPVLSNRCPPWSIPGGLYEAVVESDGSIVAIDNDEARSAAEVFQRTEKVDLDPAAAVAFASVLRAARFRSIERDAIVLLNVTGGGHLRRATETSLRAAIPTLSMDFTRAMSGEGIRNILNLFV